MTGSNLSPSFLSIRSSTASRITSAWSARSCSVALVCFERSCSIFTPSFPSSVSRSPLVAGVCAVFGLFSIDIGLHLQYRYRANRVKGMYEQGVDESLSRYARERRAAHAKGKLLMDHGVSPTTAGTVTPSARLTASKMSSVLPMKRQGRV